MKRQYLLAGLMVAALSFTACNEDYTDWAEPQSNPQEDAVAQVQASFSAGANSAIVMDNITTDVAEVAAFTSSTAEGGTFVPTSLLINEVALPYTYAAGKFNVSVSQLDSLTQNHYQSRASVARELTVKVKGSVVVDGQPLSVGSGDLKVTLTPAATPAIDENGYCIVGDFNGWSPEPMTKVSDYVWEYIYENVDGKDQYYKFMLGTFKDWNWQEGHVLGVAENGNPATSQFAVWGETGNEPGAAIANIQGKVRIQLDVENYRINVSKVTENLFMTGSAYGWGNIWNQFIPVNDTKGAFWGIYHFAAGDQIKFAPQADWGNDFGMEATISDESVALAGISNNGGNIQIGNAGWYLVSVFVDGAKRTVEFETPHVYLTGDCAEGGWGSQFGEGTLFAIPEAADGEFVSPAFVGDGEIRVCVRPANGAYDWWRTEFIVLDGKIAYRGNGGDQERVKGAAGQSLYLNFGSGTGYVK